jgi:rubredoxin-NAD+ reductase
VLLPAPAGVAGIWEKDADNERGLKYLFRDSEGGIRAYVLTQEYCGERMEMDRMHGERLAVATA